jgi:hypothetical protein
MAEAGEVRKVGYGRYCHPNVPIDDGDPTTESDRVTVTETPKTNVVSDGYDKSDKSDSISISPDTGVHGNSSKSCHSVTLSLLPKMDVVSSGYKSDSKSDNLLHVTPRVSLDLATPESVAEARRQFNAVAARWDVLKVRLKDHAIPLKALEADVPLDMSDPEEIERNHWRAAIEDLEFKARARLEAEQRRERERKINAAMAVGRELGLSRRLPNLPTTIATGTPT